MSSNMGQGGDYWGDPMSIVQGAGADDLIRAGYGRTAAPSRQGTATHSAPGCLTGVSAQRIADLRAKAYALIDHSKRGRHVQIEANVLLELLAIVEASSPTTPAPVSRVLASAERLAPVLSKLIAAWRWRAAAAVSGHMEKLGFADDQIWQAVDEAGQLLKEVTAWPKA